MWQWVSRMFSNSDDIDMEELFEQRALKTAKTVKRHEAKDKAKLEHRIEATDMGPAVKKTIKYIEKRL